jgi:hypothetical protein
VRRLALSLTVIVAAAALSGCGANVAPVAPSASPSPDQAGPSHPRGQLAARAAAAKDLRQTAFYTLKTPKLPDRRVGLVRATDGSWRIDIQGGAHGGAVDIALVFSANTLHQCALPAATHPYTGCVALPSGLTAKEDPLLEHLFTDWLNVLTDRNLAIAVSSAKALESTPGDCFSVESSTASLNMPIDAGIYCYGPDGTLTGARLSFGTLLISGVPGAAPPSVTMPGPVVPGAPLPLAAPPSPSATP